MLTKLKLKNFRNFSDLKVEFSPELNYIKAENGKGKTNIIEAILALSGETIFGVDFENFVKLGENETFISAEVNSFENFSIFYDKVQNKKNYNFAGKNISKSKFLELSQKSVFFYGLTLNIFYLSPEFRRDFIDNIILKTNPKFSQIQKNYKISVKSRNKTLKSVAEGNSALSEIDFWDKKISFFGKEYYEARIEILSFFEEKIKELENAFIGKNISIKFDYKTKVDFKNIENSIYNYLFENRKRDVLIGKTAIGPHVDDFAILVEDFNIEKFASRGEIKTAIIILKMLEKEFIEDKTGKKVLFLIDDVFSEIDNFHEEIIFSYLKNNQIIMTGINNLSLDFKTNIITI